MTKYLISLIAALAVSPALAGEPGDNDTGGTVMSLELPSEVAQAEVAPTPPEDPPVVVIPPEPSGPVRGIISECQAGNELCEGIGVIQCDPFTDPNWRRPQCEGKEPGSQEDEETNEPSAPSEPPSVDEPEEPSYDDKPDKSDHGRRGGRQRHSANDEVPGADYGRQTNRQRDYERGQFAKQSSEWHADRAVGNHRR